MTDKFKIEENVNGNGAVIEETLVESIFKFFVIPEFFVKVLQRCSITLSYAKNLIIKNF